MKGKGQNTGKRNLVTRPTPDDGGLKAAARVLAAGGRVPKKFAKARPISAGPTLGAAQAIAKITPARRVAFEILTLVGAGKRHSDELLHGARIEELSEPDRNLTTALVMGVLRWQIALDAQVRQHLAKPDLQLQESVALALRLGAFQLLHMDRIPAHAALSESVEMCRAASHPHAAGMVNAVLRRISEQREPGTPIFETTAAFAERLGHPLWLVERWVRAYGREGALAVCEADQREPGAEALFPTTEEPLPAMDEGSRLVAEIAAAAMPVGGTRVWDCCAAPGGKTLMLALRLPETEVLATDVSARRMGQMEARLRRFSYASRVRTAVTDVSTLEASQGNFDLVLCDVPCSGTGTLARNPEIRLRLNPEEFARQAARQKQILAAALLRVAPGGRLVYSTCSLEREENEDIIAAAADGWRQVPIESLPLGIELGSMANNGRLRTIPGVHPCDGFYAVVLERADDPAKR